MSDGIKHGTSTGIKQHHARGEPACDICLRPRRRYNKERALGKKFQVDAGPVWERIEFLRRSGMTFKSIAEQAGVAKHSVWRVQHQEKVRASTARAIFAIHPPKVDGAPKGYRLAVGAERRLLALRWQKWSPPTLAEMMTGVSADTLWDIRKGRRKYISEHVAAEVERVFDEIGPKVGPNNTHPGGIPAAAWDDIDNPYERPKGVA